MRTRRGFGEGSSPVIDGDRVFINWDHEGPSFLAALDRRTGRTIWKVERDEVTSWSTPLLVEHDGRRQLIINATVRRAATTRRTDRSSGRRGE
jgi:outer membrane protein assembly factor BamB